MTTSDQRPVNDAQAGHSDGAVWVRCVPALRDLDEFVRRRTMWLVTADLLHPAEEQFHVRALTAMRPLIGWASHKPNLDRDGEDLVDGIQLEVSGQRWPGDAEPGLSRAIQNNRCQV